MSGLRRRIFGVGAGDDDSPASTRAPVSIARSQPWKVNNANIIPKSPAPATRTPAPGSKDERSYFDAIPAADELVSVPFHKLERLNTYVTEAKEKQEKRPKNKGRKRRNFWIFGLGGVFGLLLAGFMANSADVIDLKSLTDMNLDSLIDVLPAGLIRDAQAMQVCSALFPMVLGG